MATDTADAVPPAPRWLYAAAIFGAHLAFMPLFILLLPRRVEAIATGDPTQLLSWTLLCGAVVAGVAHIFAGHVSDGWYRKFGSRRLLILLGAAALALAYLLLAFAREATWLFAAIIFFQLALNCAFAPLGALLADYFPDQSKGGMAGLMNAALPASGLVVLLIGWLFPRDGAAGFLLTGALATLLIIPLLVRWPFPFLPVKADNAVPQLSERNAIRSDFVIAWVARFLIQLGASFIFGYLYVYVDFTLAGGQREATEVSRVIAYLSGPAAIIALVATIMAGRISDARGKRRGPLSVAALVFAAGLTGLAIGPGLAGFLIAYALFQVGLAAFLSVDTALVAQLVAPDPHRGALLGVMNLTNTLPAIFAPLLTLLTFRPEQMGETLGLLFFASAMLALVAGLAVRFIRSVK